MFPDSSSTLEEEIGNSGLVSSSSEWNNTASTACPNQIAPPPHKKRILLESFDQKERSVTVGSNLSDAPSSNDPPRAIKPPRTYSRKRHIQN